MTIDICLDVALLHYPVMNRNSEIISSAVTNLDLHDIARAGKTFGVGTYWVITPDAQQQELAGQIVDHWTAGYGGTVNPDRAAALSLIKISPDLEQMTAAVKSREGQIPLIVATSAGTENTSLSYTGLQRMIYTGTPVVLLFGTAWGLAPEILEHVDFTLPPVQGAGEFNHLSVRSAASIILDRLLGNREKTGEVNSLHRENINE